MWLRNLVWSLHLPQWSMASSHWWQASDYSNSLLWLAKSVVFYKKSGKWIVKMQSLVRKLEKFIVFSSRCSQESHIQISWSIEILVNTHTDTGSWCYLFPHLLHQTTTSPTSVFFSSLSASGGALLLYFCCFYHHSFRPSESFIGQWSSKLASKLW